jgi:ribonuclease BN (tRNA processing enzyme)
MESYRMQAGFEGVHVSSKGNAWAGFAARIKPGLLVLYHHHHRANAGGAQELLNAIRGFYDGRVVTAHDLDFL